MNPLKSYLSQMSLIRRSAAGVKETSYYGTLEHLFNEVGNTLKPKVRCVINLANKGAGIPDGGFFTPDQFQRSSNDLIAGQLPARGAIEVKGTSESVDAIKDTTQVAKYLQKYGQVLVTNYREFLLVALDENGQPKALEGFSLANSEAEFWTKADHSESVSDLEAQRFVDYLSRVMRFNAPVSKPEDVAWFLASYARDARARVEAADVTALESIREALEESLGIKFEGEKGEHFFRSTLVQTLFYGVFSAWVLWHKRKPNTKDRFHWKTAEWELRVPMIAALFEQVSKPSVLNKLDLVEVLDWAENVLNRVVWQQFSQQFSEEHAVQYFYEPFLKAFDPELRKQLGVWYTPEEIVRYMVERVDRVLREELNLPDGLADPNVIVLDPACGTGAYLVEVLRRIDKTLVEKGEENTRALKLKNAAMSRVFGFEIMPAPFVISHMQIGLLFEEFGVGFSDDKNERAGVYLTNSLTGWDEHSKEDVKIPEMERERELADEVKQEKQILVIIGNPPYNAFAGVSPKEERGLVEPYKEGLIKEWGIKKFNLDDLYVRFFRLAERKIAEQAGKGIVCYISNFSYLSDPSFVAMRQKFLSEFDKIWIDNLNGDSRETGKTTPLGKPDPSVFSTQQTKVGIRVGTTIGLFVRHSGHREETSEVRYREFWGARKREELLKFLNETPSSESDLSPAQTESNPIETVLSPDKNNRFSLRPKEISSAYQSWPSIESLSSLSPSLGVLENRKESLMGIDLHLLKNRIATYLDRSVSWTDLARFGWGMTKDAARFDAKEARDRFLKGEPSSDSNFVKLMIRPMDVRWCYHHPSMRPIWNEPRPSYSKQCWAGNMSVVTRRRGVGVPEGQPIFISSVLGYQHAVHKDAYFIPVWLKDTDNLNHSGQDSLFGDSSRGVTANLSDLARTYLKTLGFSNLDEDLDAGTHVWNHVVAIGYASDYLSENADGVRQDFPHIPLPMEADDLVASAELGKQAAALLDTEKPVPGVTVGAVMSELRTLGVATHVEGRQFADDDFRVTAGWGSAGKGGITMPGKGRAVSRDYAEKEREAMGESAIELLGEKTFDIYLNNFAYWRNVPEKVWNYYIGGYQVIKKWLSYREFALLGRPLKLEEVEEVTNMIRRIAALILMEPELNANFQKIRANTFDWQALKEETQPLKEAGD